VTLKVYDPAGRVVRNLVDAAQKPGHYQITWDGKANDGRAVASGIYFYKLETVSGSSEQKVVVTR
jgi:flagellar hook assembly protein FlgD